MCPCFRRYQDSEGRDWESADKTGAEMVPRGARERSSNSASPRAATAPGYTRGHTPRHDEDRVDDGSSMMTHILALYRVLGEADEEGGEDPKKRDSRVDSLGSSFSCPGRGWGERTSRMRMPTTRTPFGRSEGAVGEDEDDEM